MFSSAVKKRTPLCKFGPHDKSKPRLAWASSTISAIKKSFLFVENPMGPILAIKASTSLNIGFGPEVSKISLTSPVTSMIKVPMATCISGSEALTQPAKLR